MEFKDRLRARMTDLKLSATELSSRIGVSKATITFWRNGTNGATGSNLMELAKALQCSPQWLETGKGDMQDSPMRGTEPSNVGEIDRPTGIYRYPVVSSVAAGTWSEAVETGLVDRYEISDYKAKGRAFWLEVAGDSMTAPTGMSVPEGMLILVDPGIEARPGKLVVAKLPSSNEATFKKLIDDAGQLYLKPLNPGYSMIKCSDDCIIIGVAVRMTGTLY
ncbi:LexA family protein [Pseudomonas syringae]|uniref:LexA family protein n=1 Tax=Pseudomonas syringae TaxID=317 RepID=UPI001BCE0B1E|nr:LexA family transcriptional regulator [Pseudomonas syringae]QVI69157.1 LexA family transcriptional regulator [Pseudomonas syringae]